jgi:hypothetical protein
MDSAGETHVINVENDTSEDFQIGSTLKRTTPTNLPIPDQTHKRKISGEDNRNGSFSLKDNTYRKIFSKLDFDIQAIHSWLAKVGFSVISLNLFLECRKQPRLRGHSWSISWNMLFPAVNYFFCAPHNSWEGSSK